MAMTRGQHLIGKELGSCVLEQVLGYGGSSAVFLAQQHTPERKVAVKVFLPRSTMDVQMQKDFYTRFLREAEAASKLDHPHILPIYAYGEQDRLPYIVMPYMQGGTLSEYITKHGCLSLHEAQCYLEQIASALDYAHEQGWVHCDVKPTNILLDSDGQVVLSDFGIARLMQPDAVTGQAMAEAPEMLMGTPEYLSPEQALGQPLDGRSDVYSLGIMLFSLLTDSLPFQADSNIAVALLQVHRPPPSLSLLRDDVSPVLDAVIHQALAKRPGQRFQTAAEFHAAFEQAIAASPVMDHRDASGKQAKRPAGDAGVSSINSLPVAVHVASTSRRVFDLPHLLIIVALCLMVAFSIAFAGGVITAHIAKSPPSIHATVPPGLSSGNILADGLANNTAWPTSSTFFFNDQQYHIQNRSAHYLALALYAYHQYSNFRLTVTLSEIHGSRDGADYYGVAFRSADDQSHYYLFEVAAWGGGQYQFSRYDGQWKTLAGGSAPSLLTNAGANNIITILVNDDTFTFFVNSKPVGSSIIDTTKEALTTGEIGLCVEQQGTEVAFSHLYINHP